MWEAFCKFKLKKTSNVVLARLTGSKPVENHDFDGLRLIMHNFERQFVDVPVLSVQSDLPDEREWLMSAHENEAFKAYAVAYVLKDMAESAPGEEECKAMSPEEADKRETLISKLTFMYHYCMNFRSKYTRELKTKVRRRVITEKQHEQGTSHVASISFALKEAKAVIDQKGFKLKSQL